MKRTLIAGGKVVDGTGREPFVADVLVEGDRISRVAPDLNPRDADVVVDASGRTVAPGFIDLHSHYDAQVFWDTTLSSSCHHGVTSVINGNCGFSLAPYSNINRNLVIGMLRDLEDMHTDTLEAALPDSISSFESYMAEVERCGPMLNFGSFIGHSTVRIAVMGPAARERAATDDEVAAMGQLVDGALKAGAMGFATKSLKDARKAPSQFAAAEETMALLKVLGAHGRGIGMFAAGGNFDLDRVYETQAEIGRPFTWIALLAMPDGSHHARAEMHRRWRERGADVRPQVSCRPLVAQCRMSLPSGLRSLSLNDLNAVSAQERLCAYGSEEWRVRARADVHAIAGGPVQWDEVSLLESQSRPDLVGRDLFSIGAALGVAPFDALLDLAVADKLATRIVVTYGNGDKDEVSRLLKVEGAVLGLSDAGAHPAQTCDAVLPTDLLGNWVRERGTLPLEAAVHKLTQEPALLLGIEGRGVLAPGYHADVVVFDPRTVGPGELRTVADQPAGRERLLADRPSGVHHVMVNGALIRKDEQTLRARSGQMLRPS